MRLGGEMDSRSSIVLEHAASFMHDLGLPSQSNRGPLPYPGDRRGFSGPRSSQPASL